MCCKELMCWTTNWEAHTSSILVVLVQLLSSNFSLHALQHTRLPCPSPSPRACSNTCPLNWWCHPTITSSMTLFCSCPQSIPALESFPMSWLFKSDGQSIGASASASILPMNIQHLFPLGWTVLISLLSKGLSRVFSSTTVQNHQCFGTQPYIWSNSHICILLLENPELWLCEL